MLTTFSTHFFSSAAEGKALGSYTTSRAKSAHETLCFSERYSAICPAANTPQTKKTSNAGERCLAFKSLEVWKREAVMMHEMQNSVAP